MAFLLRLYGPFRCFWLHQVRLRTSEEGTLHAYTAGLTVRAASLTSGPCSPALEAMHQRRSIREFDPELVSLETVRQIVEAAGRAPSSKNTQPWRLFLLRGPPLDRSPG